MRILTTSNLDPMSNAGLHPAVLLLRNEKKCECYIEFHMFMPLNVNTLSWIHVVQCVGLPTRYCYVQTYRSSYCHWLLDDMLRAPNNCVPNGSNNAPAILLNTADMSLLKILQFDCYKHNEPLIPILTNLCVLQYYNLQYISYPTPSTHCYR